MPALVLPDLVSYLAAYVDPEPDAFVVVGELAVEAGATTEELMHRMG